MKPYISVTAEILESLDKIMHSGLRGTHLLFSNRMIREAFSREDPLELISDEDLADRVQEALTDILDIEDFEDRQEYIELLDKNIRDILVHLYFGFLDRYMDEDKSPEVLN